MFCNHENFSNMVLYIKRMLSVYDIHHDVPKCTSCHKAIVVITGGEPIGFLITHLLTPSCFCEKTALFLPWMTNTIMCNFKEGVFFRSKSDKNQAY